MVMQEFIDTMLEPYYPGCRYLKSAEMNFPRMKSEFSIPETFYGASSGHFNATEMMMCVNQMSYVFFAKAFRDGSLPFVDPISLEDFLDHQMNCMLAGFNDIRFKAEINPREFYGDLVLTKSRKMNDSVYVKNDFSFYDSNGGSAGGNYKAALSLTPK